MDTKTFRQSCNGCDTVDYVGDLNEAGVCAECVNAPCAECGIAGHGPDDHDRRTDRGTIQDGTATICIDCTTSPGVIAVHGPLRDAGYGIVGFWCKRCDDEIAAAAYASSIRYACDDDDGESSDAK